MAGDSRVITVGNATSLPAATKKVADAFKYTFDFTGWLDTGETIATASAAVSPAGPTVGSATVDGTGKLVSVLVSGGTANTVYTLTITANLTASQVKTTQLSLTVR